MRSNINIQVINKNPANQWLRAIFANRFVQAKRKTENDKFATRKY